MFNKASGIFGAAIVAVTLGLISPAAAGSVNGDGNLISGVIFGDGVGNGDWTGVNNFGIEVALRGKLRYDTSTTGPGGFGKPQNTFNYDNDHTYTFDPADSNAPSNRSIFNFEFSVNVNSLDNNTAVLSDLRYLLRVDLDPTSGTNFIEFDPIIGIDAVGDNALGDNTTANGAGDEGNPSFVNSLSVAQNSHNLGFYTSLPFLPFPLDPQLPGIYTFEFLVLQLGSGEGGGGGEILLQTSIDIIVGAPSAVPVPAALPLFGTGIALMGLVGWRRRKAAAKNAAA